ncbi:hypothetical protein MY04_2861 [Flammeovirga sp. MY04]|uniref:DUF6044 family protein n=1 Tax=Flammeovirga sp. MY04 TaxID=1191459 RepID=UPI00080636A1|nr:DUF6044 family protein [Flammeovirga sp. MY04]ANQ50229.1 hypothetical protein MY04_2861 [Flammeovirga sp. MY04]
MIQRILKNESNSLIFFSIIIVGYYLPYFIFGEDSYIRIHDNLDSNLAWMKVVIDSFQFFPLPNDKIGNILAINIDISSIMSKYSLYILIFKVFGMYWGYIFCRLLMSFVAFFGLYYLLKRYFIKEKKDTIIIQFTAFLFSILPFWSYTLDIAGVPLFFFILLNFRTSQITHYDYILLIFLGFTTSPVLTGFFVLVIFTFILFFDLFKSKNINKNLFVGLLILSITYIVAFSPSIYTFLFNHVISHRIEFKASVPNYDKAFYNMKMLILNGQIHVKPLLNDLFFWIILLPIFIPKIFKKITIKYYLIIVFLMIVSFYYGFKKTDIFDFAKPIFKIFPIQLDRFYFMFPTMWYIMYGYILTIIYQTYNKVIVKIIIISLMLFQFGYILNKHIFFEEKITFKEFYSKKIFESIKREYVKDQRVINIGIHPAIAQFNGIKTVDAYLPSYPLFYKKSFRQIIEGELNKNAVLKSYFDNWGSRCYAFTNELGRDYLNNDEKREINNLNFNFELLKKINCRFILSSAKIKNDQIKLIKLFYDDNEYWKIYLYEII